MIPSRYNYQLILLSLFFFILDIDLLAHGMTQARDLPKILVAGYRFIPYFIFDPQEGGFLNLLLVAFWQLNNLHIF